MRARAFMTTDVLTLRPETPLKAAAAALADRNVASAPVLDDDGRLVGIVSELDLLAHDVPADPLTRLGPVPADDSPLPVVVREVMTREVITLPPSADAALFLQRMLGERVVCIPVLDEDRLVGVVSRRDLLRLLARPDADIAADVEAAVAAALPEEDWRAVVRDGVVQLVSSSPAPQSRVAWRAAQSVAGVVRVLLRADVGGP
ncbi:MAG: HPP family protein [Mycobacteriales bacterium]